MILQGHDVEKVASMEKKEDRLLTIKEKIDNNNGKSEKNLISRKLEISN